MAHATPGQLHPDTTPLEQTIKYLSAMSNWEGGLTRIAKKYSAAIGYAEAAGQTEPEREKITDKFSGLYVDAWNEEPDLSDFAAVPEP